MLVVVDYPDFAGRYRYGAPRAVTVGGDGARVVFLRSAAPDDPDAALVVLHVATGVEQEVAAGPVTSFATDRLASVAAVTRGGQLFRADLRAGTLTAVATTAEAADPRPDPAGVRFAYVTPDACLRVIHPDGTDELLAGEPGGSWRDPGGVRWGVPDPAAAEFGRTRGYWWSPDGSQILAARTARSVSLHLLDLDGGWVDVHWDRETYPYVVDVRWGDSGGPLITVLRRMQQHGLVLSVDPRTGETQVHAELADARWVEPVPGTPRYLPDGRVLVGGELAHDGFDARCLFADGSLLTPPGLYVRRVVGVLPDALIIEGTDGDPAAQDVFRVRLTGGTAAQRLTTEPGWHHAEVGGDVLVIDGQVRRGEAHVADLTSHAAPLPYRPAPLLARVTDRHLPAAVLYPGSYLAGRPLPVLVTFGAGPGTQQVVLDPAGWQERQWFADAGFAVVSIDSRGTPGVAPSFEKVVHRRLVDVALTDHVDALHALVGKHPDLDLTRVATRGTGLGGWLAAQAVTRRPEVFRRAVARDPVTDWGALPAAFAERYLGRLTDAPEVYAHHGLDATPPSVLVLPVDAPLHTELEFLSLLETA